MRRGLALVLLLVAATSASAHALAVGALPHRPGRLLVYAQEWSLWASRPSLPRGAVIVQLWNRGQDAHDLHIRRLNRRGRMVGHAQALPVTQSESLGAGRWRLASGRYELYCSLPGHYARGMHTVLIVH